MKKIQIILLTIVLGITTVILISYFTLPTISIKTTPPKSKIFINDHFYSQSPYKTKLKKGYYQIRVTSPDYLDYKETVNLDKNLDLNIVLEPDNSAEIIEAPITHSLIAPIGDTRTDILVSINRENSQLIKTENSKTTIIYSKPVQSFDYQYPIVALIERDKKDTIVFINLETNEIKNIIPKETIIANWVSISPYSSDTFILGNLDTIKRNNFIYRMINGNNEPTKITETKATKIRALNEQYLIEFAYADHNNASIISLLDTFSGKRFFSEPGNDFSVSPDNKTVAVFNSEKIITFSYATQNIAEKNISIPYSSKWLNNDTILIFANQTDGTSFALFNTKTNIMTNFKSVEGLEKTFIKSIDGITEKDIYLTSVDGKTYNLPKAVFENSLK